MECTKCSISGKKLVYMYTYYENGVEIAKCPCCGKTEIIGFGKIR